jgi:hypothetical protein
LSSTGFECDVRTGSTFSWAIRLIGIGIASAEAHNRSTYMEVSMPTVRKLLAAPLILLILTAAPALADQRHLVDPSQLAATVGEHVAKQNADRAEIREALSRDQVKNVAATLGVDLTRAVSAVDTMSGADLTRAADAARQVNQQLVGGASSLVISTTTIIIILLVVILLIVAIK